MAAPAQAPWLLAAVSYDRLVHLWQGRGAEVDGAHRVLSGTRGLPFTVAISPDARTVASAGSDHVIDLWDVASGLLCHSVHGHTNSVLCLAFHPHGELLASGSTDGTVRFWSLRTVEPGHPRVFGQGLPSQAVAVLAANPHYVYDLAFSPDGRMLASVGADRSLRLWDMTQPNYPELVSARKTVYEESEQDIFAVAFSPDGTKLACGGNHLIHLWDLPSDMMENAQNARPTEVDVVALQGEQTPGHDEVPRILCQHTSWIFTLAFSPDGATLASSGADCTVCLWDIASGVLRTIWRGHRETIYKVAFSPDGAFVLSCSFDGAIKYWELQSGECVNTLVVEGPYDGMNITDVTGITEAQKVALKALGAVEEHPNEDHTA